ncbi:MAG: hypothetical protein G01um1014106_160 [Parcubacteria group bacterium Gr01-1014_106]|nr:MAG: hypothetical protein G01um1014106_160 [Parcubacteria group bacterium Gr01-1014_106]
MREQGTEIREQAPTPRRDAASLLPVACSLFPQHFSFFPALVLGTLIAGGLFIIPQAAFADPHATFFTNRGQEQLFFNVLAALNQSDFVEPPSGSTGSLNISSIERIGDHLRDGVVPTPQPSSLFTLTNRSLLTEPAERIELPRIRVRQVTSDDGDVYFRERVAQRALVEAQRVEFTNLLCSFRLLYFGEIEAKECLEQQRLGGV